MADDDLQYDDEGAHDSEDFDLAWHRALSGTLEEWNGPEDERAFSEL